MDIINDLDSLKIDSRSPLLVAGRIWFDIGGSAFPGERWSDSPLSVLGSLGEALSRVVEDGEGDVYFFEGPFFVKLLADGATDGYSRVRVCGVRDAPMRGAEEPVGVVEAESRARLVDLIDCCALRVREFKAWASEIGEREVSDILGTMDAKLSSLRGTL